MNDKALSGVHWSVWVIGAIGLVFNLMGCVNFISQMNADMGASMPEAYRAIVESRPVWGTGVFSIAVFGGALGCLLLLIRKSIAFYVLIASLVGAIAAQIPLVSMTGFPVGALIGGLSQVVIGAFLTWYSMQVERKGWIR
jgi:hypothetical protein